MRSQENRLNVEELNQRIVPSAYAGPAGDLMAPAAAVATMTPGDEAAAPAPHGLGAAARARMPEDGAAFRDLVVRAWKDPEFREELGAAARQYLPANPAGFLGVVDDLLDPDADPDPAVAMTTSGGGNGGGTSGWTC